MEKAFHRFLENTFVGKLGIVNYTVCNILFPTKKAPTLITR